jgi:hypothetical protein
MATSSQQFAIVPSQVASLQVELMQIWLGAAA